MLICQLLNSTNASDKFTDPWFEDELDLEKFMKAIQQLSIRVYLWLIKFLTSYLYLPYSDTFVHCKLGKNISNILFNHWLLSQKTKRKEYIYSDRNPILTEKYLHLYWLKLLNIGLCKSYIAMLYITIMKKIKATPPLNLGNLLYLLLFKFFFFLFHVSFQQIWQGIVKRWGFKQFNFGKIA